MKTRVMTGIAAVALIGASVWAVASPGYGDCDKQGEGWGPRGGGYMQHGMRHRGGDYDDRMEMQQRRLDRMGRHLSLSAEQRQQVEQLMGQHQKQYPQQRAQMQQFRQQMQQLDPAADDYAEQVEKLAKQRAELMSEQMVERAKHHAELFAILTPEQQQSFKQYQERKGYGHHPRWDDDD